MKISSGKFKGKTLITPKGTEITHPTSSLMKDAVIEMLKHSSLAPFSLLLDCFAGSGAVGFEALSNEIVKKVIFIDTSKKALVCLRENIKNLGLEDQTEIILGDALRISFLSNDADLIFIDPPYEKDLVYDLLFQIQKNGWKNKKALFVVQMEKRTDSKKDIPEIYEIIKEKIYGNSKILFLTLKK